MSKSKVIDKDTVKKLEETKKAVFLVLLVIYHYLIHYCFDIILQHLVCTILFVSDAIGIIQIYVLIGLYRIVYI